ncbi:hypothetical protein ABID20_004524 [Rhizobium alvei]
MNVVLWGLFLACYVILIASMAYAHERRDRSIFLSGLTCGVVFIAIANQVAKAVLG